MGTNPRSHGPWLGHPGREPLLSPPAATALGDVLFVFLTQVYQGRGRLGKEGSDVDIEGYEEEEEEDGKPQTPVPVRMFTGTYGYLCRDMVGSRSTGQAKPQGHSRGSPTLILRISRMSLSTDITSHEAARGVLEAASGLSLGQ